MRRMTPYRNGWRLSLALLLLLTLAGRPALADGLPPGPAASGQRPGQFAPGPNRPGFGAEEADLKKRAEAAKTAGQLAEVLMLEEWRYLLRPAAPPFDREAPLHKVHKDVASKFLQEADTIAAGTDTARKLALAHLIGDLGLFLPEHGLSRDNLVPDLAARLRKLAADQDPDVRAAALTKLGPLTAEAEKTLPLLEKLLRSEDDSDRVAAARSLALYLHTLNEPAPRSRAFRPGIPLDGPPRDNVPTACKMTQLAGVGLKDANPQVRGSCLAALGDSGRLLLDLTTTARQIRTMGGGPAGTDGPPRLRADLQPLRQGLKDHLPNIVQALKDKGTPNRLQASAVLEVLATVHREDRPGAEPGPAPKDPAQAPLKDFFGPALRKAVPLLADNLQSLEVKVQLAAIYVLETLEAEAAPAAPALAAALTDKNAFVRWGAARALGRLAPQQAAVGVPALTGALKDDSTPVRVTALAALKRYGPAARTAVPGLIGLVNENEENTQELAIDTLAAVAADAEPVLPALAAALKSPHAKVRQAAAQALGRLGKAVPAAVKGLRQALNDPEAAVRRAASLALLNLK